MLSIKRWKWIKDTEFELEIEARDYTRAAEGTVVHVSDGKILANWNSSPYQNAKVKVKAAGQVFARQDGTDSPIVTLLVVSGGTT